MTREEGAALIPKHAGIARERGALFLRQRSGEVLSDYEAMRLGELEEQLEAIGDALVGHELDAIEAALDEAGVVE